jgi:hypothetical protein
MIRLDPTLEKGNLRVKAGSCKLWLAIRSSFLIIRGRRRASPLRRQFTVKETSKTRANPRDLLAANAICGIR